ncbi:hypothetical protein R0J91_22760, partial [Micrococcus sp. SIMBA_131]
AALTIFKVISTVGKGLASVITNILSILKPFISEVVSFFGEMFQKVLGFWNENGAQIIQAVQNFFKIINGIVKFLAP